MKLGDAKVFVGDHFIGRLTTKPVSGLDFELTFTIDDAELAAAAEQFRQHHLNPPRAVVVWSTADEPSAWVRANPGYDFERDRTNGVPNEQIKGFSSKLVDAARQERERVELEQLIEQNAREGPFAPLHAAVEAKRGTMVNEEVGF